MAKFTRPRLRYDIKNSPALFNGPSWGVNIVTLSDYGPKRREARTEQRYVGALLYIYLPNLNTEDNAYCVETTSDVFSAAR